MSRSSLRAWLFAVVIATASVDSHAAGLGRLEVKSALGEPFRAEIAVLAEKNEIASLSARMASQTAFQNAGLVLSSAISGMRVAIEKRASGEAYVSITSKQPVNEPVVDLLVELVWASGRVTREYTAFVDPPFIIAEREKQRAAAAAAARAAAAAVAQTQAAPTVPAPKPEPLPEPPPAVAETAPAVAPAAPAPTEPSAPVKIIGGTQPTLLTGTAPTGETPAAELSAAQTYGPVKRGDNLTKIARSNLPSEITLEQMLVLLFRSNPDAFSGKNMNRLKTGKIMRFPAPDEYSSVSPADARREFVVQARDWNAYRERLAAASAAEAPPAVEPTQQAAAGPITPKVEEKPATATQQPKEVLRLSKGEPAAGAGAQERLRALEEELVARDKAVKESNERVARLEKTINDLQSLLEVKNQGMAELQKQAAGAAPAAPPATKPAPATPATAQPPQAAAPAAPAAPAQSAPPAPKPDMRPETPAPAPTTGQGAPGGQAAPPRPATPQQPRPRPAPPPPSLIDQVLEQPYYIAAAALIVALIGFGAVRVVRRRREAHSESEEVAPATIAAGTAAGYTPTETDVGLASRSRDITEEVDPLEEAEIFLAYGRDAQAEELLKEALASSPRRFEIRGKLLEIFAKRGDTQAFESTARELQQGTGGRGEIWERALRLGYQIDPGNPRYAAGRPSGEDAAAGSDAAVPAERLDFDVGLGGEAASTTATDIDLGTTSEEERTQVLTLPEDDTAESAAAEPTGIDFNIELPPGAPAEPEETTPKPAAAGGNTIDFDFDVSRLDTPAPEPAPAFKPADLAAGMDFDVGSLSLDSGEGKGGSASSPALDLSGISLDLGGATTSPVGPAGKDEKWYEIQTKFDLAKAYQEMGDNDGAREILKEVIAEGDSEQQAAAEAVLSSLK